MRRLGRAMLVMVLLSTFSARSEEAPAEPRGGDGIEPVPKVLYIVPWKELKQRRPERESHATRIERALAPVARDALRRELELRRQLSSGS